MNWSQTEMASTPNRHNETATNTTTVKNRNVHRLKQPQTETTTDNLSTWCFGNNNADTNVFIAGLWDDFSIDYLQTGNRIFACIRRHIVAPIPIFIGRITCEEIPVFDFLYSYEIGTNRIFDRPQLTTPTCR